MQQCLKRFIKTTYVQDWTLEEINQLKVIVKELKPHQSDGWKQVSRRMGGLGTRRTQKECKNKGIKFLSNQLRLQIKLSPQNMDELLHNFELGNSSKVLTNMYPSFGISPQKMREILTIKLDSIKNIIKRIVGNSKLCSISVKDYNLFPFIRSHNQNIYTLGQVAEFCRRYKTLERSKKEEDKREAACIQASLTEYNSIMKRYYRSFQQQEKAHRKKRKNIKLSDTASSSYSQSSQSTPVKQLSNTTPTSFTFLSSPVCSYSEFSDFEKKPCDLGDMPTFPDFQKSPAGNTWFSDMFDGKGAMMMCSIEDAIGLDDGMEDCSELQIGRQVTEVQ